MRAFTIVPKNPLCEVYSVFGFDWIWGRYLLSYLRQLDIPSSAWVLDVGCGNKPYRKFFPTKLYFGVDLPRPGILPDVYGNALALPLANASVDVCFSVWLLDDLIEPQQYFDEAARVLRENGMAIMVDIQSFPEHDAPLDYYRLTRFALKHHAQAAGLEVERIEALGGFWAQIGIQLTSFFLRGVSGYYMLPARLITPFINLPFFILDRLNPLTRGAFAHFAVLRKP